MQKLQKSGRLLATDIIFLILKLNDIFCNHLNLVTLLLSATAPSVSSGFAVLFAIRFIYIHFFNSRLVYFFNYFFNYFYRLFRFYNLRTVSRSFSVQMILSTSAFFHVPLTSVVSPPDFSLYSAVPSGLMVRRFSDSAYSD